MMAKNRLLTVAEAKQKLLAALREKHEDEHKEKVKLQDFYMQYFNYHAASVTLFKAAKQLEREGRVTVHLKQGLHHVTPVEET